MSDSIKFRTWCKNHHRMAYHEHSNKGLMFNNAHNHNSIGNCEYDFMEFLGVDFEGNNIHINDIISIENKITYIKSLEDFYDFINSMRSRSIKKINYEYKVIGNIYEEKFQDMFYQKIERS